MIEPTCAVGNYGGIIKYNGKYSKYNTQIQTTKLNKVHGT